MDHDDNFQLRESAEPRIIEWLSLTGMVISVSILSAINKTEYSMYKQNIDGVSKLIMTFSLSTTLLYLFSAITVSMCTVIVLISDDHLHNFTVTEVFAKSSLSLYCIAQTAMIFLFVIKTHFTFKGSAIAYSPFVTKCLYFSSVFFLAFFLFLYLALLYERWSAFVVIAGIWVILYFVISLSLCIAFIRKIEFLLQMSHKSGESVDDEILFVLIKHALLVPIAICSSFVCFTCTLIVNYLSNPGEWVSSAMFWIAVDSTISSISIYLLFAWNDGKYKKYCSKWHAMFANLKVLEEKVPESKGTETETIPNTATATSIETIITVTTPKTLSVIGPLPSLTARHSESLLANDSLKQNPMDLNQTIPNVDIKKTEP